MKSLSEYTEKGGKVYLLDTGSTDETINVANNLGCVVFPVGEKFLKKISQKKAKQINDTFCSEFEEDIVPAEGFKQFDYSAARNYIAELCPTDWVFMPDCDEVLTKFDLTALEDVTSRDGLKRIEYDFVFSHYPDGSPAIQFLHSKFYRKSVVAWDGIIHEVLVDKGGVEIPAGLYLPSEFIRLEHYQNPSTDRKHYLTGLAIDCHEKPNDRKYHYFGRELLWTGRPHSAIGVLDKHVATATFKEEIAESYILMSRAYTQIGDEHAAITSMQDAIDTAPWRRETWLEMAKYYYLKDAHKCVAYASAALSIPKANYYANEESNYTWYPHVLRAWGRHKIGDILGAKNDFDAAYFFNPDNPDVKLNGHLFYPPITVLIPHIKGTREAGLKRVMKSIANQKYPNKITVKILYGEDTVPQKMKRGVENSDSEWFVYAADDVEFAPTAFFNAVHGSNGGFAAFNTGPVGYDDGNICEHFIFTKELLNHLDGGMIFHTDFNHIGCDNYLYHQLKHIGRWARPEGAHAAHYHFSKTGEMDEVYERAWNEDAVEKDRATLKQKIEAYGKTNK